MRESFRGPRSARATPWLAAVLMAGAALPAAAQFIVMGNDNKNDGLGKDQVMIFDIGANPGAPKLVASLNLENSVAGPPTNVAVVPGNRIALVANALHATEEQGQRKTAPDTRLYVIDLTTSPPQLFNTIEIGKQPSGMAVNKAGDLALVCLRADNAVAVLAINGKDVKLVDTVPMGDSPATATFTPDGKHALVAKNAVNKIAWLNVDGRKVTYNKYDMNVGQWPYNVIASPKGDIALVANTSGNGVSDGNADIVSVIDLTLDPPRVIDHVVVGDGPEGLAISPNGDFAAVAIQNGGSARPEAFFYHKYGLVDLLRIDGKKVTKVGSADVGGFAEGIGISPDGSYVYVGGNTTNDFAVLKVEGNTLREILPRMSIPGRPASMAVSPR